MSETFSFRGIRDLMKKSAPHSLISKDAVKYTQDILNKLVKEMTVEAAELTKTSGKKTITAGWMESAKRRFLK